MFIMWQHLYECVNIKSRALQMYPVIVRTICLIIYSRALVLQYSAAIGIIVFYLIVFRGQFTICAWFCFVDHLRIKLSWQSKLHFFFYSNWRLIKPFYLKSPPRLLIRFTELSVTIGYIGYKIITYLINLVVYAIFVFQVQFVFVVSTLLVLKQEYCI